MQGDGGRDEIYALQSRDVLPPQDVLKCGEFLYYTFMELKDIVGYLPYRLEVIVPTISKTYRGRLVTCFAEKNSFMLSCGAGLFKVGIEEIKPVLHPMTDLTKSIMVPGYHEDAMFVPLVELARQSLYDVYEYSLKILNYPPNCIEIGDGFILQYEGDSFLCLDSETNEYGPVNNFVLFDLLNHWHFDDRGLIKSGLAVDVNAMDAVQVGSVVEIR